MCFENEAEIVKSLTSIWRQQCRKVSGKIGQGQGCCFMKLNTADYFKFSKIAVSMYEN